LSRADNETGKTTWSGEEGKEEKGPANKPVGSTFNGPTLLEAGHFYAKKIGADAILFYMDSTKDLKPLYNIESDIKIILLTKRKECMEKSSALPLHALMIPDVQLTRTGYIKIGFLSAISKGLLKNGDVIVCVGGIPEQGYMDTIMLVEIGLESQLFSENASTFFPPGIRSDYLFAFVLEPANQGREENVGHLRGQGPRRCLPCRASLSSTLSMGTLKRH
jgi:hypothetical protein